MLDQGMVWKSQFEKPRILVLLTGLVFMHLMVIANETLTAGNYFLRIIVITVFAISLFISHIVWTDRFESSLLSQKKLVPQQGEKNFNLKITDFHIQKLYSELVKYDLIIANETSLLDFKNVLTQNWDSHNSKINFNMDAPSCREFYNCFTRTFPNNTMTIKNVFITSRLILRPDGKRYNYNTLKNAPTRTPFSKHNEILFSIFEKLKES